MELKEYQKAVLADVTSYLRHLRATSGQAGEAYRRHWAAKGVEVSTAAGILHPYRDKVGGAPDVTLKVPTGGGKTLIACYALRAIFRELTGRKEPQVAVWAVPSDTILKQTLRNLSDRSHPYRKQLDELFLNAVRVVDKEEALTGGGISPAELETQLTILVVSVQSFVETTRRKATGGTTYLSQPRAYRENGVLAAWTDYFGKSKTVKGADTTSLIQYIANLHPVMIIDESHNFGSMKRTDLLQNLNPAFILDLTATPREESNLISIADAMSLKRAHMVKLPVIVYNKHDREGVIDDAVSLRTALERIAREEQDKGGRYVRPIVLFQAEPKNGEEKDTYDKIRQDLIEKKHIPKEQIRIKVSGHDELEGEDLLSETCPVRYIITVNALKEGWDCPFAYILATVANRSSKVEVEQTLGRILRQPRTQPFTNRMLNMCYVLTCSDKFNEALQDIIRAMELCGFSGHDYRVAGDEPGQPAPNGGQATPKAPLLPLISGVSGEGTPSTVDEADVELDGGIAPIRAFAAKALEEAEAYDNNADTTAQQAAGLPKEVTDHMKFYPMIDRFANEAAAIRLPYLYIVQEDTSDLFTDSGSVLVPVSRDNLLGGFDLRKQKSDINLTETAEITAVDVEERRSGEYVATLRSLSERDIAWLKARIDTGEGINKGGSLADTIAKQLSDADDAIPEPQYRSYVQKLLEPCDVDTLKRLVDRMMSVVSTIRYYVENLKTEYAEVQFDRLKAMGRIVAKESWSFPKQITFTGNPIAGLAKGLYTGEQGVNPFELDVISKISQLGNVRFWHRNQAGKQGFRLNGYVHNHFPDFIVRTTKGNTILLETKGGHLNNSDSAYKIKIGKAWKELSGSDYHYFMAFPDNTVPPKDALVVSSLVDILKAL